MKASQTLMFGDLTVIPHPEWDYTPDTECQPATLFVRDRDNRFRIALMNGERGDPSDGFVAVVETELRTDSFHLTQLAL